MDNVNEMVVGVGMVLITLVMMAAPVMLLLALMRHQSRQKAERYRFLLELADRQQPLTPELLHEPSPAERDRRRGLVLVCAAAGLWMTLQTLPVRYGDGHPLSELWGLACLPLMVGLGYLASWWVAVRGGRGHG